MLWVWGGGAQRGSSGDPPSAGLGGGPGKAAGGAVLPGAPPKAGPAAGDGVPTGVTLPGGWGGPHTSHLPPAHPRAGGGVPRLCVPPPRCL